MLLILNSYCRWLWKIFFVRVLPGIGVWTSTFTVAVALTLVIWWDWGVDGTEAGGVSPRLFSSLLQNEPCLVGIVVVSTTTSGSTTISCEEYWLGSSVIVVRDTSEGIRGYGWRPPPLERDGVDDVFFLGLGEGSGEGVGILSSSFLGLICKIKGIPQLVEKSRNNLYFLLISINLNYIYIYKSCEI